VGGGRYFSTDGIAAAIGIPEMRAGAHQSGSQERVPGGGAGCGGLRKQARDRPARGTSPPGSNNLMTLKIAISSKYMSSLNRRSLDNGGNHGGYMLISIQSRKAVVFKGSFNSEG
jgi:hypothetical protein